MAEIRVSGFCQSLYELLDATDRVPCIFAGFVRIGVTSMANQPLPGSIRDWIQQHNWGWHHLEWHTSRQWDTLTAAQQQWALQQGWQRAARQAGRRAPGARACFHVRTFCSVLVLK
jgi:hypothetical protein